MADIAEKRIYELGTTGDPADSFFPIDKNGNVSAEKISYATLLAAAKATTIIPVSARPGSATAGDLYFLDTTDGIKPAGFYTYGTGWICLVQLEDATLPNWTGAVEQTLVSGVSYQVEVTGEVTFLDLTMTDVGTAKINIYNPGEEVVAEPSVGYKTTSAGLDALSETTSVRLVIQNDGGQYEYSATERVSLWIPT